MIFSDLNATNKTLSLTYCEHTYSVLQILGGDETLHISDPQVNLAKGKFKISSYVLLSFTFTIIFKEESNKNKKLTFLQCVR